MFWEKQSFIYSLIILFAFSKDLSILKHSVPEFIKSNMDLMSLIKEIKSADIEEGGKGALIIYLKNSKE